MSIEIGFIYVLSNESIPGLLKIGFTTRSVEERAEELYTTGVPTKFKIEFKLKVTDPGIWERKVHEHLSDFKESKEWFRIPVQDAIQKIHAVVGKNGLKNIELYTSKNLEREFEELIKKFYSVYVKRTQHSRGLFRERLAKYLIEYIEAVRKDLIRNSKFSSIFWSLNKDFKIIGDDSQKTLKSIQTFEFELMKGEEEFRLEVLGGIKNNLEMKESAVNINNIVQHPDGYIQAYIGDTWMLRQVNRAKINDRLLLYVLDRVGEVSSGGVVNYSLAPFRNKITSLKSNRF